MLAGRKIWLRVIHQTDYGSSISPIRSVLSDGLYL
jgi:hypothetical protein